jgi:threonine dehydrogenase-like Zn-dependent dehydrogenase
LYHSEMPGLQKNDILGHEAMGIVDSVGPEVTNTKVGDRGEFYLILMPFTKCADLLQLS